MDAHPLTDPLAWAQHTFGAAQLGDPRRSKRLVRLAAAMAADPQGSLPRQLAGDWAALKGAYRLLHADGVTPEAISRPVWQQTRQQMEQEPAITLIVHDDTQIDYGYRPAISGLGPIGNGSHRGFLVHTVLAEEPTASAERVLGVLHQEAWVRQPAARQADSSKQTSRQRAQRPCESEVWLRAVEQVGAPPLGRVWIHVADRYADMVAFLQRCRQLGTFFVVRAAQDRRVVGEPAEAEPEVDHLRARASAWSAQASGSIEVPSEHERRARLAQVQLSWGGMRLLPPQHGPLADSEPVAVWVVRVWEPEPPSKDQAQRAFVPNRKHGPKRRQAPEREEVEALEWVLLSALPVESVEQAWQVVHHYQSRWPIEDFHRGIKTGCALEQRHLQEQGSLETLLAIVSPIAVRLLQLRNLCREEPTAPALEWVEPAEAQVIAAELGVAVEQLTIEQFTSRVAQLGGFLCRACDGPPGWQTLWQGWLRLRWMVAGLRLAASAPPDRFARSPCTCG